MPQYELNLRDYSQIIRKRPLVLMIIFFIVLISTILYTNAQKPVYRAIASVQWIERKTLGGLLTELVTVRTGDPLVTQSRIITSLPILERVALELGLVGKFPSAAEVIGKARQLQGAVLTDIVTGSNLIRIIVTYENPEMAAKIANKIAQVYITENLKEKTKAIRAVREFIEKQLEEVSAKLETSEEAWSRFKEVEVPSGVGLNLQNKLADLEVERAKLLQKYTSLHPDVENINEQINQVKEQLKALPHNELEYNRLTRDVEINTKLYRELKDKLEGARISEAEKTADVTLVDRAAPSGVPVSPNKPLNYFLGALIGLMLGLAGTFVVEQLDTSIGTIEDVESILKLPALGVIPYLRTKEKRPAFMRRLWAKKFKGKDKILRLRNQLLVNYSSSSPIFEAYRILMTNIQSEICKEKIQGKTLLFSSAGPEEGKSITISNLAIVMAEGGLRVLLVDGDMRRSKIHTIFGLQKKEPGLSNVLTRANTIEEAIRKFTDILMGELGVDGALKVPGLDNLSILTSGSLSTIPTELLGSTEFAQLLEKLREQFDLILIDSPPVLAVADAAILAPKTDGVILVYRVGKTARSALARTKTQLTASGASVKGVVLNNISPQMEMRYGYYYHYKYYGKYYDEKKEGA
jgi:Mrp family chromosome partitioning ATPase/uncharacterized protein involved in exopolysaccharide biosynthesis